MEERKLRIAVYKNGKKVLPVVLVYLEVFRLCGLTSFPVVTLGLAILLLLEAIHEGRCLLQYTLCVYLGVSSIIGTSLPLGILGMILVVLGWEKIGRRV